MAKSPDKLILRSNLFAITHPLELEKLSPLVQTIDFKNGELSVVLVANTDVESVVSAFTGVPSFTVCSLDRNKQPLNGWTFSNIHFVINAVKFDAMPDTGVASCPQLTVTLGGVKVEIHESVSKVFDLNFDEESSI